MACPPPPYAGTHYASTYYSRTPPPGVSPPPVAALPGPAAASHEYPMMPYRLPPPHPRHHPHAYDLPPHLPHRGDDLRTLFVAGLPGDTKAREIYNLFREFPGYLSSQLRSSDRSSKAYGFAVFTDQQSAVAAKHALNGMVFDLEKGCTLHIDLAKSNSRGKQSRRDDELIYPSGKRTKASLSQEFPSSGVGSDVHFSGISIPSHGMSGSPPSPKHSRDMNPSKQGSGNLDSTGKRPCATLYVANLASSCSQEELTQFFSRCPGFLKLKYQRNFRGPVAFVDFQDVQSSTAAMHHLQGTILHSATEEGLRVEYANSRMGVDKHERT